MPKHHQEKTTDGLIFNEAQLLLAEKRTSLSKLRTGIAVSVLPFTVVSFLRQKAISKGRLVQGCSNLVLAGF